MSTTPTTAPSLGTASWEAAMAAGSLDGLDEATVGEVLTGLGEVLVLDDGDRVLVAESLRRIIATAPTAASWGVLVDLTPRVSSEYERNLLATAWRKLARHAGEVACDVEEGINPVIDPVTGPDQGLAERWEVEDYYHAGDVAALISRGPGPDTIAHAREWSFPDCVQVLIAGGGRVRE